MRKLFVGVLFFIFSSTVVNAQLFRVIKDPGSVVPDEAITAFEKKVNDNLPDVEASEYLDAVANAVAISGRGSNVDYVSGMTLFAFGGGVGVGGVSDGGLKDITSSSGDDKDKLKKIQGAGFSANILLGMNMGLIGGTLGPIDMDRLNVFVSFFTLDKEIKEIEAKTTSFAIYGQYKLFKGLPLPSKYILNWTGLDVAVGLSHTTFKGKYNYKINESVTESGATINYDGDADIAVDTKTTSVTAEVSSGVNILYALGLYAGLGIDLNTGDASAKANSTGDITSTVGPVGQGIIDVGDDGKPDASFVRSFVGLQINAWLLKIYAQANIALAPNELYGVNIGTRVVW